ncbi:tRNA (cytosine(34)-C(5))-methyltransferase [Papilio machaon]|uniref:tRNA (Cytosine(34)-C(5))-methyltransferase n=1 Tax=Papilio machaon TaxID=76193 RepID=A0A0N0PDS0_PAPMA|nr:tRNA (cytosine(34)-C(5))-methyltransferase [Papilio machaon]
MDTDPPDPGGGYENCNILPQTDGSLNNNRKRTNYDHDYVQHNVVKKTGDLPIPSIQSTYITPEFTLRKNKYEGSESPFLVHVSKKENESSLGVSLRPIHFGYFLSKNNIKNVLADGVKRVGRNRISVEFKSASDANSFLELPTLTQYNYEAVIPSYNCNLQVLGSNPAMYPGGIAWQLRLSRTDIRRNEPLYKLHNFLVAETAAGGVSRQEAVSMIPPVVLKVEPHHKVGKVCSEQ